MGDAPRAKTNSCGDSPRGPAFPQLDGDPSGISQESGEGGGRLRGEGESLTRGHREGGRHRSESARRVV